MFYLIEKVADHPCVEMQSILEKFFKELWNGNIWDINNQHPMLGRVHGGSNFVSSLEDLYNELLAVQPVLRKQIAVQFINNNEIELLCENEINLLDNIDWSKGLGKKISDFFLAAYPDRLDLSVFKRQGDQTQPTKKFYQEFIEQNGHVCPFCSILPHKHPFGRKRSDFDHYMDKAHFPMATLNLDNLIPMCTECNQDYKHTSNILFDSGGSRRTFLYPYNIQDTFSIEIVDIVSRGQKWDFIVTITSSLDPAIVSSFDSVFNIKERIQRELAKRYDTWLDEEAKRYSRTVQTVSIPDFKSYLLGIAQEVIDPEKRMLESKLLEQSFFAFLAETDSEEINDVLLCSYII